MCYDSHSFPTKALSSNSSSVTLNALLQRSLQGVGLFCWFTRENPTSQTKQKNNDVLPNVGFRHYLSVVAHSSTIHIYLQRDVLLTEVTMVTFYWVAGVKVSMRWSFIIILRIIKHTYDFLEKGAFLIVALSSISLRTAPLNCVLIHDVFFEGGK